MEETVTQRIAKAYLEQERTGRTNKEIAKKWFIKVRSLQNFKLIAKYNRDIINILLSGDSLKLNDPTRGCVISTNRVNTIARIVNLYKQDPETCSYTLEGRNQYNKLLRLYKNSKNKEKTFNEVASQLVMLKYPDHDK